MYQPRMFRAVGTIDYAENSGCVEDKVRDGRFNVTAVRVDEEKDEPYVLWGACRREGIGKECEGNGVGGLRVCPS